MPESSIIGGFLHRLLLVVAFAALALPSVGPLFDHHFAERQPDHLHIYPGGQVVKHLHPYGLPHAHRAAPAKTPDSGWGDPEGIVYLTAGNSASFEFISLTVVSIIDEVAFSNSGDSPLLFRVADSERPLTEFFSGVQERPPIV